MYLLRALGMVVIVWLYLRIFCLEAFVVTSDSMAGVLFAGDYVLAEKLSYAWGRPRRFDVVIVEHPELGSICKRAVGLPGEQVQVAAGFLRRPGGGLYGEPWVSESDRVLGNRPFGPLRVPKKGDVLSFRDGVALLNGEAAFAAGGAEPWRRLALGFYERLVQRPLVLAEGQGYVLHEDWYMLMGDARGNSFDGRTWGFMPRSRIEGRVVVVYWAWSRGRWAPRWERLGTWVPRVWRRGPGD